MAEAIGKLPRGSWRNSMTIDGFEAPVVLAATLTVGEDSIHVDFDGTSGLSAYAINCPLCYTEAYTAFGVKALVAPWVPNNTGTLDAVTVSAPADCIVNPPHPAAVYARSIIGHMLPDLVYGCLHQALAGDGAGGGHLQPVEPRPRRRARADGRRGQPDDELQRHHLPLGRRRRAAAARTGSPPRPSRAACATCRWRSPRPSPRSSSGARSSGAARAGRGASAAGSGSGWRSANREAAAFGIFARFERLTYPARGRDGGEPGATGRLSLGSGAMLKGKGFQVVPAGDRLVVEMPGGGGLGDPFTRDPALVARDVRYGLLEAEQARAQYGVALAADGEVDEAETARLRRSRAAAERQGTPQPAA